MDGYKGVDYLRGKLAKKSQRVILRYRVYDMKEIDSTPSLVTPQWLKGLYRSALGWCTKSVNALADRLVFKGFAEGDDIYGTNSIFEMNNPDIFFDSVIRESLIAACAFVHISHGDGDEKIPKLSVLTADNATGIIDEFTGLLKEGYAVLSRDEFGAPTTEAYFTKEYTEYYKDGKVIREDNPAQYPLLVPVPFEPTSKRPFGHSRISRDCMDLQKEAQRALERADISAEFYSFPQKYVTGLDPDADPMDSWKASASSFLRFDKDENGDSPKLGQFTQQSMAPYIEQVRMFASLFSGATGLTMDDLGFVTDNPSSAEAIKAAHENLRQTARRAQRTYASAFANVGYIAASVRDNNPYPRTLVASMRPQWEPIFEPDAAMITSIGDGAIKINQAVPGFFDVENLETMTGIESNAEPIDVEEAPEAEA